MFEPKFNFTPKMVNELGTIERIYGQILGEKLIPSLALKLSEENLVLATHHSTSIEGNPLSPQDVTNIVLGDQIPVTKSEKEVKTVSEKIGFDYSKTLFCGVTPIYAMKYDIKFEVINNQTPRITFDMENPFLKLNKKKHDR